MSLKKFMSEKQDGVFYIGHASALVRINGHLILFDPIWDAKPYGEYWTFNPLQVNCDEILDQVEAVVISHIHADHLCETILKKFNRDGRVLVMDGRVNLNQKLTGLGHVVMGYEPFRWWPLPCDIEIYFVQHPFNSIDSSCFVRSKEYCVYVGSDNFLDDQTLSRVRRDVGRINVAMVPYAFIHWYPFLLKNITEEERLKEIKRLNHQSLIQAQKFCDVMGPDLTVAFGNNLFYIEGKQHILNKHLLSQEDFGQACEIGTGDYILKDGTTHIGVNKIPGQFKTLPPINTHVQVTPEKAMELEARLKKLPVGPNHDLIINGITISLLTRSVYLATGPVGKYTKFNFDSSVFYDWLNGKITFEQAIGTRRFECVREPNEYRLDVFEWFNNYL